MTPIRLISELVHKTAHEMFGEKLRGTCHVCSIALCEELKSRKLVLEARVTKGVYRRYNFMDTVPHVWVFIKDLNESFRILDPTACQFDNIVKYNQETIDDTKYRRLEYVNDFDYHRSYRRGIGKRQVDFIRSQVQQILPVGEELSRINEFPSQLFTCP